MQVLATAAPYNDVERDEMLGYVLDEVKIVGQSVCSLQHCSNGAATPFTIDAGVACRGASDMHHVGACSGALNTLSVGHAAGTQGI